MKIQLKSLFLVLFMPGLILLISACSSPDPIQLPTQTLPSETPTPTTQPTPTETNQPLTSLTICTSGLPEDLFLYGENSSNNKSNLLSLIYEAPFITMGGEEIPTILKKIPTADDGDLVLESISVQAGQKVVDGYGRVKILKTGLQVRPSGCRSSSCMIAWDGESPLEMDQMVVAYQIREDLAWSDGSPVVVGDSVFSFETAADLQHPGSAWAMDRTQSYQAIDQTRLQWRGLPGFSTADLSRFFWKPLAAHLYQDLSSEGVLEGNEGIRTSPVGYGPFFVSAWEEGFLEFSRNPYYFRVDEGLPRFDQIQVRQVEGGIEQAWLDLQNGACDVLDSTFNLSASQELTGEVQSDPEFDLVVEKGDSWIQLVFGIQPASHDDFYNPELGDRPDYFGDNRTRQAVMHCLDRVSILESVLGNFGEPRPSYLPIEASRLETGERVNYDPAKGMELLQSVGWYDLDGDPSTPLQSWYVQDVPPGASLSVELLVGPGVFNQEIAETIQNNLAACGIGVTVDALPIESLYAPGPEGPLFGRQFEMALLSWQPMPGGDCQYYQSWNMPADENYWIGTNVAGLLNESYDNACAEAVLALPGERPEAVRGSELAFLDNLPAVPLFSIPEAMVIPSSNCFDFEISSEEEFFAGIAAFGIDEMCP